jgi:hypothetical protein
MPKDRKGMRNEKSLCPFSLYLAFFFWRRSFSGMALALRIKIFLKGEKKWIKSRFKG